jgi:glucokinase
MSCAIGLDLGGTKIKGLAVTPAGRVLAALNRSTSDGENNTWIENARRAVEQLRRTARQPVAWIGVAAPGLPAKDQRSVAFMPGRLPGLEGLIWQNFLHVTHPVPVLNDAQAALLGEAWCGAARRSKNVLLLTLGTGVGGAALVDGRLLRGHIGRAGHLGHISLNPAGALDITNTPGSLEDAIGDCTISARSGGRFNTTKALVTAARRGNAEAQRLWRDSIKALAAGVASLINAFDPEVIVIGGGIAQVGMTLLRPLKTFLNKFEWRPGGASVRIVPAKLGDRAGTYGAAWNAIHFQPQPPGL